MSVPCATTPARGATLGLHLFRFVREIHRPYRDSIRVVSDYLLEHAGQDDLAYVAGFAEREALTFSTGQRLLFCCFLDAESPLPRETVAALGARLSAGGADPEWIVLFRTPSAAYRETVTARYALAARPEVFDCPTQRPEINRHACAPLPAGGHGVYVLRRRDDAVTVPDSGAPRAAAGQSCSPAAVTRVPLTGRQRADEMPRSVMARCVRPGAAATG